MSRRLALPTLLAVLAAVVLATRGPAAIEGDAAQLPAAAATERVITYALTPGHGPRFRLPGGPQIVRLTAHLVIPLALPHAPGRRYGFAVEATLRGPDGEVLWQRNLPDRASHTKAGPRPGGWAYEAAYAADRRFELSDGAGFELALPDSPPGSLLELRLSDKAGLLGPDETRLSVPFDAPTALVRAHRRVALELASEGLRRSATAAALGRARLAAATFLPWHALAEALRARAEAEAWERMPAEGHAGIDYRAESVYVAAGPPPPPDPPDPPALAIAAGQSAVVHLLGPGAAIVRTRGAEAISTATPQTSALRTRWLGDIRTGSLGPVDMNMADRSILLVPVRDSWQEERILLPPGWTELEMSTDLAGAEVQILAVDGARHAPTLDAPLDAAPIQAPAAPPPLPPCSGASRRAACSLAAPPPPPALLVPVDLRTFPLYLVGPDALPLPIALAGPPDIYSRTLRFDVRSLDAPAPVRLRVEFLDDRGRLLTDDELLAEPVELSHFDRVRPPSGFHTVTEDASEDDHAPLLMPALGLPLAERPVSEPASVRLLAPPGAVRLQVSADAPALLDVRGVLPPPATELVGSPWLWPYDQVSAEGERWRYAPRHRDRWFPLRAEDHASRLRAGLVIPLQAQIRREPDPPRSLAEGPWETLPPATGAAPMLLHERVPAARRAGALARWGPGDVATLRPGFDERLDLRRGGPGVPTLRYQVMLPGTGTLGQPIDLTINDASAPWRVTARAESRRLPRSRPVASVLWSSGPDPLRMFANRPPLTNAPIYAARALYRLDRRLSLPVVKRTLGVETVHAVVYWLGPTPRGPTSLHVAIDGGAPRRHGARGVARVTQAERTISASPEHPAELMLPDRTNPVRAQVANFTIRLGDDLSPGRHTISLERVDGPPVWIRFFRSVSVAHESYDPEDIHDDGPPPP